jgi:opacity protein-like surface antigen
MNLKTYFRSALTVAALAAIPAAAVAQMKIIAVQAKVGGTNYGVAPNTEPIPVTVGDRVRVDLVGTSIEGGRGVERQVNARFNVAGGRGQLDIGQSGSNWVTITIRSAGDGTAQLGYSVTGNYDMRGNMRDGRITFQIADNRHGGGQGGPVHGRNERWERAQDVTRRLYRGILGADPRGDEARNDTDRIARDGSGAIRDISRSLAVEAQRQRSPRMGEDEAIRVLGDLYRGLLGRDMSNRDLWERDRGFHDSVGRLRRDGLVRIVDSIVTSEEFRSVNKLNELDRMPRGDRDGRDGRGDRDRH